MLNTGALPYRYVETTTNGQTCGTNWSPEQQGTAFYYSRFCGAPGGPTGTNPYFGRSVSMSRYSWTVGDTVPIPGQPTRANYHTSVCVIPLADRVVMPALAKIGESGSFGTCQWSVPGQSPFAIGPDFKDRPIDQLIWWVEASIVTDRAILCLATQKFPSMGLCFRMEQDGNVEPGLDPRATR